MAEQFELYRLSLLLRLQRTIFEREEGPDPTREQYLRRVFGTNLSYNYNSIAYHYVAEPQSREADVVIGRVGRSLIVEENRPPSEGLAETTRESWKAAVVVLDPKEHADGQKLAVEIDRNVANPGSLVLGLIRAFNREYRDGAYSIEWAPIIEVDSFWAFVARNKGNVTTLEFEFVVPNMFGGSDSITDELRSFREREKARRVTIKLQSKEGLDPESERTKEAVDYVSKAGGVIRARLKKGRPYSSTDKAITGTLPRDGADGDRTFSRLIRYASHILGRDT